MCNAFIISLNTDNELIFEEVYSISEMKLFCDKIGNKYFPKTINNIKNIDSPCFCNIDEMIIDCFVSELAILILLPCFHELNIKYC